MNKYTIELSSSVVRDIKKLSKDKKVSVKIQKTFEMIASNPFDSRLKSHLVNVPSLGRVWSSRVTGDLRLEWAFNPNNQLIIFALRLQGHDTVYK